MIRLPNPAKRAGSPSPGLSRWLEAFDRQEPASENGADAYGHA
ncbi:hypothetical protein [Bosea sp. LjRoot237]